MLFGAEYVAYDVPLALAIDIDILGELPPVLACLYDYRGGFNPLDESPGALRQQCGAIGGTDKVELALRSGIFEDRQGILEGIVPVPDTEILRAGDIRLTQEPVEIGSLAL